jgi:DNA-binding response OmpR family regulator
MDKVQEPKSHILVVDDDVYFLQIAAAFLEEEYEVSLAKSGAQALEYLGSLSEKQGSLPVLILLDVSMPDMDGYTTLRHIKDMEALAATPVVFLTGMSGVESELQGLRLGAVDYIVKPFFKEILLKRVEIHLRQGKELAQVYRERRKKKKPEPHTPLTPWELNIARFAQQRLTSTEIAKRMETTAGTIRTALNTVYIKLDIHSKRELADLDL